MKKLSFKENLKELRVLNGLTQKQLGEKLSVDQRTVSAWENGVCEPDFKTLMLICEIFGESADSLLYNS